MRTMANTLFALAIGGSLMMEACSVARHFMMLTLFSVGAAAILTNLPHSESSGMWVKSVGLVGIGGLSFVYTKLAGQNLAGTILVAVIAILVIIAVVLMFFDDLPYPSKRKKPYEVSKTK